MLYIAALGLMPRSVNYILDNIDPRHHLSEQVCVVKWTPLQAFETFVNENNRTGWDTDIVVKLIHDQFNCYSKSNAQIVAELKGLNASQCKYGCTYEDYVGGILSPGCS